MSNKAVQVGIGVIVIKNKKVLVGKRKGSHAAGCYSFPGGHLDFGENWNECSLRELSEECGQGMKVRMRKFGNKDEFFVTNDVMDDCGKHYVTIFMVADWLEGEPVNMEPHKCEGWEWIDYDQLSLYDRAGWIPINIIEKYRTLLGI